MTISPAHDLAVETPSPAQTPEQADISLLRRFEPVLRFTRGEQFFPMDVDRYVGDSSLWMQRPGYAPLCLVPEGALTSDLLARFNYARPEAVYFLKFIDPLNLAELAAYEVRRVGRGILSRHAEDVFHAGLGRLARVGYLSRFVDALFTLSLLARGNVPGDTAAAAARAYAQLQSEAESYRYYGRVLRRDGWVILQYWFFYAFNNWRSGFFGVNDHEADWEMITLYLDEPQSGDVRPEWVAYASHDASGDDLRRRWDDPEVFKMGEHPVVFTGAGSHASYFSPGEYMAELEIHFLRPLSRLVEWLQHRWRKARDEVYSESGPAAAGDVAPESGLPDEPGAALDIFRVPFVDFARGDGVTIGPEQPKAWAEPVLLEPLPGWAANYRGLWGLYARDPIAGENAPAGPLYNRDGTLRRAWYDPLGWAGLDKLPPPHLALARLSERVAAIKERRVASLAAITAKSAELTELGVEIAALYEHPHLLPEALAHQEQVEALSVELTRLRQQVESDVEVLDALEQHRAALAIGARGPLRAHIRRAHRPATASERRRNRIAELWAATSIGGLLLGVVLLALFSPRHVVAGLSLLLTGFVFIEAGFRRQMGKLVSSITILLALIAAGVILYEFFWQLIVVAVVLIGIYLTWENLRELV